MAGSGNGNGTAAKAIGGLGVVGMLIGAMAAFMRPMNQRVDTLGRALEAVQASIAADNDRERKDLIAVGAASERFKEIETQFRHLASDLAALKDVLKREIDLLDQKLQLEIGLTDKEVARIREWREQHSPDALSRMVSLEERMKVVERALKARTDKDGTGG